MSEYLSKLEKENEELREQITALQETNAQLQKIIGAQTEEISVLGTKAANLVTGIDSLLQHYAKAIKHCMIVTLCSWCGLYMGITDDKGKTGVSHGICPKCYEKEKGK